MGFFKSISKGDFEGAIRANPITAPFDIGLEALGIDAGKLFSDPFGVKSQVDALKEAGRFEEAQMLENRAFRERLLQEGAPFREAARGALGQLQEEVRSPIGGSPLFQRGLRAGQAGIRSGFGRLGGAGSSAEALAQGELASGLAGGEIARRQNILGGLAAGSQTGLGLGLGAQQLGVGLAGRRAQTIADIGATRAAGQQALFGTLGQIGGTVGGFALGGPTGGFFGGQAGGALGSQFGGGGGFQLQQGQGFGAFRSPFGGQ